MSILQHGSVFVMRELAHGAAKALGGSLGESAAQAVGNYLGRRLVDHGQRFNVALRVANDRAWRAIEVALEGDSWWGKLKGKLKAAEDQAFAGRVRAFVEQARLDGVPIDRNRCADELREARQQKHLEAGALTSADLARRAEQFAAYRDPAARLDAEITAVRSIANALRPRYPHLAAFLHIQIHQHNGDSLLAVAVRYFFRRAVEEDEQLARGLEFARFEKLQGDQERGFAALHETLAGLGGRLEVALGEVREVVIQTHGAVLDIRAEQGRHGDKLGEIYQLVHDLTRKIDLSRAEQRRSGSVSLHSDAERQLVRALVERYRALPADQRLQTPALLNGIGKLEVAAGEFHSAEQDFRAVAQLVRDPAGQAEAHHNAYLAALQRRDWDAALRLAKAAAAADARRFAPFPLDRYEPLRVLGGGGFGVAFLCEHRELRDKVVVKSLFDDGLGRSDAVLDEARVLWRLEHPSIIRVSDCGFADPAGKKRPYIVMQFFDGQTLAEAVGKRLMTPEELLPLARRIAEGLAAAHARGVLHRDVKPANVMVRPVNGEWEAKLIDFGLAVGQGAESGGIAGTAEFAAPEQMGRLPGVPVTARSDIYGFGKTCCFALCGRATPLRADWNNMTKGLADVLERCLQERPEDRPASAEEVLSLLAKVRRPRRRADAIEDALPADEADLLLSQLRSQFTGDVMLRLLGELRRLRRDGEAERAAALASQASALARQVPCAAEPAFALGASGPLSARPALEVAPGLVWDVWMTLWTNY